MFNKKNIFQGEIITHAKYLTPSKIVNVRYKFGWVAYQIVNSRVTPDGLYIYMSSIERNDRRVADGWFKVSNMLNNKNYRIGKE